MKFLAALLLAAGYRLWKEARGVLSALLTREPQVTEMLKRNRLEHCSKCLIYFAPMGTCGSPLSKDRDLGCHCFMEKKAGSESATCWLNENDPESSYGWPPHLQ